MAEEEREKAEEEFEEDMKKVKEEVRKDEEVEFAYPGRKTLLSARKLKKTLEEIKVPSLEMIREENKARETGKKRDSE